MDKFDLALPMHKVFPLHSILPSILYNIFLKNKHINLLTPFFSQTPPAFFKSPVQARPRVPISKSRYVNMYAKQNAS